MSTIQIDRHHLFHGSCERPNLHIAVGHCRCWWVNGMCCADQATRVLEPDDTVALMKSITPDRGQQELQEMDRATGFAFSTPDGQARSASASRFFARRGTSGWCCGNSVQTGYVRTDRPARLSGGIMLMSARGLFLVISGADGFGENHHAGGDDQLHQHPVRPAHHHGRRPAGILSRLARNRSIRKREVGRGCAHLFRGVPRSCGRIPMSCWWRMA